ncbi:hypothetical protein JCM10207_006267 [Rhodosporidiobolus poonsookiae]
MPAPILPPETIDDILETLFNAPHLALFTRELTLVGSHASRYNGDDPHGEHWTAVREMADSILPLMANLTSFCAPDAGCGAVYSTMLGLQPLPEIRCLTLYRTTPLAWQMVARMSQSPDSASIPDIVRTSLATIRELSIGIPLLAFPPIRLFTALEHFSFDGVSLHSGPPPPATHCARHLAGSATLQTPVLRPRGSDFYVPEIFCAPNATGLGRNLPQGVTSLQVLSSSFTAADLVNVVRTLQPGSALKHLSYMRYKAPGPLRQMDPGPPVPMPGPRQLPGPDEEVYAELREECQWRGITAELVEEK